MEKIKFIADILASIAVFIYALQFIVQKKSLKEDHERSRREKGVDILNHWFSTLDKNNSTARKLAENLSEDNLLAIWHCEEFEMLYTSKKIAIFHCFIWRVEKQKKENIHVSAQQATEIRWQLISYLNALENVVAAWKYNIVDRRLIEAEFKYMFDHKGGH